MTTTTDHLIQSDRRATIMDAARATVAEIEQQTRREHERRANAAVNDALPIVSAFLESYGADPTNGIASGPCLDPDHALAWITTAAGFAFEIAESRHPYVINKRVPEVWLLHPETGSRVLRVTEGTSWDYAASRLVQTSPDNLDHAPEPAPPADDHPADRLVSALLELIDGRQSPEHGGF